jgi:HAD superfamily hydrolase (TIGR01459 family)
MPAPVFAPGLHSFADRFGGFIIDQWGVLHDGTRPYPDVAATLAELKRRRKRIVLLSNSGRRAAFNEAVLGQMGLDLADFDAVVTSGEATWLQLKERRLPEFRDLGQRCVLLTREGDRTVAEGLGLTLVEDPAEAEFIFLSGVDGPASTLEDYLPLLDAARAQGLPVLCANPDLVAVSPAGLHLAPGTLAEYYERQGGRVIYVGKPYLPIYDACLEALDGLGRQEIIAIGDSLQHDIKGANAAGIASAFVREGIHAAAFPEDARESDWRDALDGLAAQYGGRPDFVIPRLVW